MYNLRTIGLQSDLLQEMVFTLCPLSGLDGGKEPGDLPGGADSVSGTRASGCGGTWPLPDGLP